MTTVTSDTGPFALPVSVPAARRSGGRHVDPTPRPLTAKAVKRLVWNAQHGRRAAR